MANLDELDPMSPEYEAEIERLQDEEDAANGNLERTASNPNEDDPSKGNEGADPDAKAQATPDPEAKAGPKGEQTQDDKPAASEPAARPKVAGIASKDGSRVLPYSALQAERERARNERIAREQTEAELKAAREQLEAIKAGKSAPAAAAAATDPDDITDEELEDLKVAFPAVAKALAKLKSAAPASAKADEVATPSPAQQKEAAAQAVQEDIDAVPDLLEWQTTDPEKWARAVQIDNALQGSRKWASKSRVERFEEVARQVRDEFDIDTQPQTKPTPSTTSAREVVRNAPRAQPNTLTDLKGGATPATDTLDGLAPSALMDKFAGMTDAQIDAYLARLG